MKKIYPRSISILLLALATSTPFSSICLAQDINVVKITKKYRQQAKQDSNHLMVPLHKAIPGIIYDLQYAGPDNFTNQTLYSQSTVSFLRLPAATALASVQKELASQGFQLKIYDAYRPYSVTKKMWDLIKDERYVANPAKGSGHNRGLSVDITLVDRQTGKELDMGTAFDNFTDTAHHAFTNLPQAVLNNRSLLKTIMEKYGFKPLSTEWWHYSWPNDRHYEVLNLSFQQLRKASR